MRISLRDISCEDEAPRLRQWYPRGGHGGAIQHKVRPVGNGPLTEGTARVLAPPKVRAVRGVRGVGEDDVLVRLGAFHFDGAPPAERRELVAAFFHTLISRSGFRQPAPESVPHLLRRGLMQTVLFG